MLRTLTRVPGATPGAAPRAVRRAAGVLAAAAAVAWTAGCYNYNITDPNGPTLTGLTNNPTRANVSAAVTGLFAAVREPMEDFVWRVGSMGREGINLSGNNQPDYQEPYFGPLSSSEFGANLWDQYYVAIRDANLIIDATPKAPDLSKAEQALVIGTAQTEKALSFMYIIETRASLGAPVDVDRPPNGTPAPFVTEDSVWATVLHTLDSARANLAAGASAAFPFPIPAGFSIASTPATFDQFSWMLTAKALCFRATAQPHAPGQPGAAGFYAAALTALDSAAIVSPASGNFQNGVFFDYSTAAGDIQNGLSDPLNGPIYFALAQADSQAQTQAGGALDERVLTKIAPIPPGQAPQVQAIPIQGTLKFTIYLSGGTSNPSAPIPIIRDEELVLLRAEAEIGTGDVAGAVNDLNAVRQGSGNLPAYSGATTPAALIAELMYNRRYSLMWEQGTRWIDGRRFFVVPGSTAIPAAVIDPGWNNVSGFPNPQVPSRMPIPQIECNARNLGNVCDPLNT